MAAFDAKPINLGAILASAHGGGGGALQALEMQRRMESERAAEQQRNMQMLQMFVSLKEQGIDDPASFASDLGLNVPAGVISATDKLTKARKKQQKEAEKQQQIQASLGTAPQLLARSESEGAGSPSLTDLRQIIEQQLNNTPGGLQNPAMQEELKKLSIDAIKARQGFREAAAVSQKEAIKEARDLRKQSFDQEGTLLSKFVPLSKQFREQRAAFGRVEASVKDSSAAGDFSLIFNFLKVLDPESTVREGEFAAAASAAGLSDRLVALAARVDSGKRLSDPQRQDFANRSRRLFAEARKQHIALEREFKAIAKRNNLNPKNAVPDFKVDPQPPASEKGAEFVGYDLDTGTPRFRRADGTFFRVEP